MKILLFSTLFPNEADHTKGIFVENRLRHLRSFYPDLEVKVLAPIPYFPFKNKMFGDYAKFAAAPKFERRYDVDIYHPRYLLIPKVGMNLAPDYLFKAALKAAKKIRADGFDFDLIDAHYLYPDGVAAARLSRALGKPFVMTARGSDVTQAPDYQTPRKMLQQAISKAGYVFTVSESLRRGVIGLGGDPAKVKTLRNGVDLAMFYEENRAEKRAEFGFDGALKKTVFLYVGWLIHRKRIDLAIRAVAKLADAELIVVGEGEEEKSLRQLAAQLGVFDRVHFVGKKHHDELRSLYSAADILLLMSEREGWPNVLLEAMACGTPVVATDVGGVSEFVNQAEAGRTVADHQVSTVVTAIEDLLANYPARGDVRRYAEGYSWEETSHAQMRYFKRLIGSSA